MVLQVLAAGHIVTAHSRRLAQHGKVERAGGHWCWWIDEAVRDAGAVGVNVYSDEQSRETHESVGDR